MFSTKARRPFLRDKDLRDRTHAYLAVTCKNQEAPFLNIGDVVDHVHILCRLSKVLSIGNLVQEVKRESSKWVKK